MCHISLNTYHIDELIIISTYNYISRPTYMDRVVAVFNKTYTVELLADDTRLFDWLIHVFRHCEITVWRYQSRKYNDQKKKGQTELKRCKLARTNVDIKI